MRNAFWLVSCNKRPPKNIPLGVLVVLKSYLLHLLNRVTTLDWPQEVIFSDVEAVALASNSLGKAVGSKFSKSNLAKQNTSEIHLDPD